MRRKRILILTVLAGMGHIRAAEAVCEGIKEVDSQAKVRLVNPLASTNPCLSWFINTCYLWIAKHFPWLWGWFYDSSAISSRRSPLRYFGRKKYSLSIQKDIKGFKPQVIVSTHPFTTDGTAELKRRGVIDLPLVSIATDYHIHPFGISDFVDLFIVPGHRLAYGLESRGIAAERIKVCGIPVSPKFKEVKGKGEQRKVLNITENLPVVLILSGGFGLGPIEKLIRSFAGIDYPLQLLVVAGRNEKLKRRLEEIIKGILVPVKIYGFVSNMESLMEAANLVVSKPGGISTSEAIIKGLPLIFIKPVKGQEVQNVNHLVEEGIALYPENIRDVPQAIVSLLSNQERLSTMHKRALKLGKPEASIEIAKTVLSLAQRVQTS